MKRSYEKPMLNASMNGTLEGVYAYGTFAGISPATKGCQPHKDESKNPGCGNRSYHYEYITRTEFHWFPVPGFYKVTRRVLVWD